ncbi:MAG: response regulator [Myxococcales bacterium]|nr:response regulator [Myxococcales bacterium]
MPASAEPARLLVVDDNEDNRDMLSRRLRKRGFTVDVAESGHAALDRLNGDRYDLVVLDVMMPGLSGLDVLKTIREKQSRVELPVLMATAKTDSADVIEALELGANDYVTKPLDFPVVLARINAQLRTRQETPRPQTPTTFLPPDGRATPGTVLDGRYRVESILGEGAHAIVFRATQLSTGQLVAVKVLHAERANDSTSVDRRRFEREMRVIGRLHHPNVVRLIDFGTLEAHVQMAQPAWVADGTETETPAGGFERLHLVVRRIPYLVMEYLDGETLGQLVKRVGPLEPSRAVELMLPVLSAVAAAHASGVLHRDLKPPNIHVVRGIGGQLEPKVLDFGIAKPLDDDVSVLTMNQTTSLLGTPEYMAPEQLRESAEPDGRVDQYALGCILYELLVGDRAFRAGTYIELLQLVANGKFTRPRERVPSIPEELEAIVLRAMHKEADARFPSVEDFAEALLGWGDAVTRARWSGSFAAHRGSRPSTDQALALQPAPIVAVQAEQPSNAEVMAASTLPLMVKLSDAPSTSASHNDEVTLPGRPAVQPAPTPPLLKAGIALLVVGVLLVGAAVIALALR